MMSRVIKFNLLVICIYTFYISFVTLFAQFVFPEQAMGSIIIRDSKIAGSKLLGQRYESSKYFQTRNGGKSASGLDLHISYSDALTQINTVAEKRGVNPMRLKSLIDKQSEYNIFSEDNLIDTTFLNLSLDKYFGD